MFAINPNPAPAQPPARPAPRQAAPTSLTNLPDLVSEKIIQQLPLQAMVQASRSSRLTKAWVKVALAKVNALRERIQQPALQQDHDATVVSRLFRDIQALPREHQPELRNQLKQCLRAEVERIDDVENPERGAIFQRTLNQLKQLPDPEFAELLPGLASKLVMLPMDRRQTIFADALQELPQLAQPLQAQRLAVWGEVIGCLPAEQQLPALQQIFDIAVHYSAEDRAMFLGASPQLLRRMAPAHRLAAFHQIVQATDLASAAQMCQVSRALISLCTVGPFDALPAATDHLLQRIAAHGNPEERGRAWQVLATDIEAPPASQTFFRPHADGLNNQLFQLLSQRLGEIDAPHRPSWLRAMACVQPYQTTPALIPRMQLLSQELPTMPPEHLPVMLQRMGKSLQCANLEQMQPLLMPLLRQARAIDDPQIKDDAMRALGAAVKSLSLRSDNARYESCLAALHAQAALLPDNERAAFYVTISQHFVP